MTGLNLNSKKFITIILPPITSCNPINGVTTNYYLNCTQIIAEETNGNITEYLYNSTGVIGFRYRASTYAADKWDIYFFEKNLQGDIVAVYTSSGVKKISYTYDAWGNFTKTKSILTPTVVVNNPFTYRGYYYDKDLGLYYLNSRYYDSQTGRFISADVFEAVTAIPNALTDKNLYAYCDNNPVMRQDNGGEFWLEAGIMAIGGIIGGAINGINSIITQAQTNEINWTSVLVSTASGFVNGAVAASPLGRKWQAFAGGVIGGLSNIVDAFLNGEEIDWAETTVSIFSGTFSGWIGGDGANYEFCLSNTIRSTKSTIIKETGRANQRYAQKTIKNAVSYRNNIMKTATGSGGYKYILGTKMSDVINNIFSKYINILRGN